MKALGAWGSKHTHTLHGPSPFLVQVSALVEMPPVGFRYIKTIGLRRLKGKGQTSGIRQAHI